MLHSCPFHSRMLLLPPSQQTLFLFPLQETDHLSKKIMWYVQSVCACYVYSLYSVYSVYCVCSLYSVYVLCVQIMQCVLCVQFVQCVQFIQCVLFVQFIYTYVQYVISGVLCLFNLNNTMYIRGPIRQYCTIH